MTPVKTLLGVAIFVLFMMQAAAAQSSARATPESLEHMRNFSAYVQLKMYPQAVAEFEKANGKPEMPHLLPEIAFAYDQIGQPLKAISMLERITAPQPRPLSAGAQYIIVGRLEDYVTKAKSADVRAAFKATIKKLPPKEALRKAMAAAARKK